MSLFSNPTEAITEWAKEDGFSYLASCVFHMVLFLTLALVLGSIKNKEKGDAPSFETPPVSGERTPLTLKTSSGRSTAKMRKSRASAPRARRCPSSPRS